MALKPDSEIWNFFTNIVEEGMAECKMCKQRLRNNRSYNLKLHLKKVHNNRGEVNKYFDINVEDNVATCKTCKQHMKNRLCNLRLHMRRSHDIEIKVPEERPVLKQPPSPQPYDEDQIKAVLKVAKRKMYEELKEGNEEKRLKRRLYIRMDKSTIIRSVIGLIVEDGVSPHICSSKNFEAILKPMCEAISDKEGKEFKLDEDEIERLISLIANYIRNDFSNDLHSRLLSIRIDTDINALPNTFAISAQFIQEGEINNRLLGIINLKSDEQLKEDHIKNILYKYNIDSNQVISAFWNHSKEKYKQDIKNSDYLKEIEDFLSYPELYLGDIKIERYIGDSAQMCLLETLKNSSILQKFLECRNMAKFLSEVSNGYYELFEKNNLNIPHVDSPWKWGSTYKMMHNLHEARDILKNVKFEKFENPEDQFNANDELWAFIEAFSFTLVHIQKAIIRYYTEELHIGDFYAQWLKSKLLTEKMLSNLKEPDSNKSLILNEILKVLKNRTSELLEQDRFVACIFLDPRFQNSLKKEEKLKAVEYLKKLWSHSKLYTVDDTVAMESADQMFDDEEDAFLNEFLSHDGEVKDSKTNDVYQKIEGFKLAFQVVDTNVLLYWRGQKDKEPEMQALSTVCFAIPATEIYDKIRYSHVYRLDIDSDLSSYSKENLLNIRLNAHLLDEALGHLQLSKDDRSQASTCSEDDTEMYGFSEDDNSNTASTLTNASMVLASASANITVSPLPSAEVSTNRVEN